MKLIENVKILQGHEGAVYKIVFDERENKLYSVGGEGWLVEWDVHQSENGVLLARVPDQVFSLAVSPDYYFVGSFQGNFYIINREERKIEFQKKVHRGGIFDIHWNHEYIYTFGGDGRIIQWSFENLNMVKSVQLSNQSLRTYTILHDRDEIAVGCSDTSIYVLSYPDLYLRKQIEGAHEPSVFALLYSDQRLLSGGRDARIRIWDPADNFRMKEVLDAHWYAIYDLIQTPSMIISSSRDKSIRWWDRERVRPLASVKWGEVENSHVHSVNTLAYDPVKNIVFSASDDRTIRLWAMK